MISRCYIITNAMIWDAIEEKPYNGSVVVKGEEIINVSSGNVDVPDGFELIDANEKWLIPGLIDCHVHLCSPLSKADHEPYWKIATSPPLKSLFALRNAQEALLAGFTTLRNCGGVSYGTPEDILLRNAINSGVVLGPRIIPCGGGITMTGGHGDRSIPLFLSPNPQVGLGEAPADGVDQCRKEVRRKIRLGADFIKIYTTGGVSTPGDGPQSVDFTNEELGAIVNEAHNHGKYVATHAQGNRGIRTAVAAGVDTVEHGSFLDEETAALMKNKNISLVPTLAVFKAILARGKEYPNPETIKKVELLCESASKSFKIARDAGINIALGTDASVSVKNGNNGVELLALKNEGLSAVDTLRAATVNSARAIGQLARIGTIESGKSADMLLLDRSPFEYLEALAKKESIMAIFCRGRYLDLNTSLLY